MGLNSTLQTLTGYARSAREPREMQHMMPQDRTHAACHHDIGAVVIGRNEGTRLHVCLCSLSAVGRLVYVDSGSTDGSVQTALALGADVVALDMAQPFTAARARNAGLARLSAAVDGGPALVQFVDADCEVVPGWLDTARAAMQADPRLGAVAGRRRERHPGRSVYNRLCDREWDTPVGPASAIGGDAMIRAEALHGIGGFRASLIAGEEPEMCLRLRREGWTVARLDAEMTLHDAAMTRFGQWWTRARRAGYAFAEGAALHGASPERHWVAETRRAVFWGAGLPAAALAAAAIHPAGLALLLAYPAQFLRLTARDGSAPALFSILGKFAESTGIAEYWLRRLTGRNSVTLIEYK